MADMIYEDREEALQDQKTAMYVPVVATAIFFIVWLFSPDNPIYNLLFAGFIVITAWIIFVASTLVNIQMDLRDVREKLISDDTGTDE